MNILATSSPPPPPTTHIHIHIWWSVVFSQLISGQINQRPYLQSICWEGAVGSRRHSDMLDNNRKWKDSSQTLQASHFTAHYVLSIQMSGQKDFFFPGEHTWQLCWFNCTWCNFKHLQYSLFCSCLTHQQPPNDQLKTHKRRWVPILQMQNTRCWFTLNNSGNILRWLIKREVLLTVNGAASFEGDKCVCLAVYRKITPLVMWSFSVNTFLISITRFSF